MTIGVSIKIMGILNVTPDSFSDGGKFADFHDAVTQADELIKAGADILTSGRKSTRPFSDPVSTEEDYKGSFLLSKLFEKITKLPSPSTQPKPLLPGQPWMQGQKSLMMFLP